MIIKPSRPYYNIDAVSKGIVSEGIFDGYRDESGALNTRFGFVEFCDTSSGGVGNGLFYWDKLNVAIAVSNGRCWKIASDATLTELTGANLLKTQQAIFAEGQKIDNTAFAYLCNGGKLNYSTSGNFTQAPSPAPQTSDFVVYNALRFLANETGTARIYFTDINPSSLEYDPTYWAADENPLTTDSRGDNVTGLYQAWDDVAAWGSQGREIWQVTQGSTASPLAPRLGALCEAGLIAPYSVQKADNTFFALCRVDQKPAVVRLEGNDPVIISLDIEKVLDAFTTLNDAIGDLISIGGQSFYILTFPTEDQTWVYNIKQKEWYRWGLWNSGTGTRGAFLGVNFIYIPLWGKHLCQSRADGKIYTLDPNEYHDSGTTIIKTEWQSGWVDGDTTAEKTLDAMRLHLKRGWQVIGSDAPIISVKYRDNGSLTWKNERQITLGLTGQNEFYRRINDLGQFRSRQFSISLTDPAKLILVKIDLDM